MRYYILQCSKGDLIQIDSITRETSGWSSLSGFISLDKFRTDGVFWGRNDEKFSTYRYKVLLTSDEKITKQTNPELFL